MKTLFLKRVVTFTALAVGINGKKVSRLQAHDDC